MSQWDQVSDLSDDNEELSAEDAAKVAGGATPAIGTSLKLGGIGKAGTAGATQITTDESTGDVDQ